MPSNVKKVKSKINKRTYLFDREALILLFLIWWNPLRVALTEWMPSNVCETCRSGRKKVKSKNQQASGYIEKDHVPILERQRNAVLYYFLFGGNPLRVCQSPSLCSLLR
jgi:hypothetical protein